MEPVDMDDLLSGHESDRLADAGLDAPRQVDPNQLTLEQPVEVE